MEVTFYRKTESFIVYLDDEDAHYLNGRTWRIILNRAGNMYLRGRLPGDRPGTLLHRLIMCPSDGMLVDHKNRNGLDNRKSNLRVCTQSQNQANKAKTRGKSMYKGLAWHDRKGKQWGAVIQKDGTAYNLGRFTKQEDAARAYDKKAIELFGDFALLNFPDENQEAG